MIAADGRFRVLEDDDAPLALNEEDRPSVPAEDVLSAMTEAQLLEVLGKIGASIRFVLLAFDQTLTPSARRPLRSAYANLTEAKRLTDAVLGSTTRRV